MSPPLSPHRSCLRQPYLLRATRTKLWSQECKYVKETEASTGSSGRSKLRKKKVEVFKASNCQQTTIQLCPPFLSLKQIYLLKHTHTHKLYKKKRKPSKIGIGCVKMFAIGFILIPFWVQNGSIVIFYNEHKGLISKECWVFNSQKILII